MNQQKDGRLQKRVRYVSALCSARRVRWCHSQETDPLPVAGAGIFAGGACGHAQIRCSRVALNSAGFSLLAAVGARRLFLPFA